MELVREQIKINDIIGEDSVQSIVEGDIIVPDNKPDVIRILQVDGEVCVKNREILQERLILDGYIRLKILYITDDSARYIRSINTSLNYNQTMDIEGIKPDMRAMTQSRIEHIDHNILNGRKINVKAVLATQCKVYHETSVDVISDITGMEEIQTLKSHVKVNNYIGEGSDRAMFNESLEVPVSKPCISEILRNDVKITGKEVKITDNKVIVKGELNISTLYIAEDEAQSIQFMEHEVPFTRFIDLPGATEDISCDYVYEPGDISIQAAEDSDGEKRVLKCDLELMIRVAAYSKKELEILNDSFSPRSNIAIDKKPVGIIELVGEGKSQNIIKDTITIPGDIPEISEVYNVICKPGITEQRIVDDRVIVEGIIDTSVLYLTMDAEQPAYCHSQEIPFRHYIDIKGVKPEMACDGYADIEHSSFSMASTSEVEIRLVICINAKVTKKTMQQLAVKAEAHEIDMAKLNERSSITIYYVQPGDTLWSIAKRYLTTIPDLVSLNGIQNPDAMETGRQIIITKKA